MIEQTVLRAFADLAGDDELVAIDWHHPSYRYSPRAQLDSDADRASPVFPDGDYHGHMTPDLAWGTFGHPWQQTLTVWGDKLVATLGTELLTWLPKHGQSRA